MFRSYLSYKSLRAASVSPTEAHSLSGLLGNSADKSIDVILRAKADSNLASEDTPDKSSSQV